MFIRRLRNEIPHSLKFMIDAILDKQSLYHLDMSNNAFGPDCVKSFEKLLETSKSLKSLSVINCGLGPLGGEMIGNALLNNTNIKLKEFYGSRGRLENEGLEALGKAFTKQKSLEKVEVFQSGSKDGLKPFFLSLVDCKDTVKYVNVSDNKSINRAIDELCLVFEKCTYLEYINISDNNMRKKHFKQVCDSIITGMKHGSRLHTLVWSYDLGKSPSITRTFLKELADLKVTNLKEIVMNGVVNDRKTRKDLIKMLGDSGIKLVLFSATYTDESS